MPSKRFFLLLGGVALIFFGYWLLAVPSPTEYDEMLRRARQGVFSVVAGGALLMTWLAVR